MSVPSSFSALAFTLALLFTMSALPASAQAAAGDGIQVDPDSAPAAEYALPLDAARGVGAGSADDAGLSGTVARPPAFGSGITEKAATTTSRPRSDGSSGKGTGGRATPGGAAETTSGAAADTSTRVSTSATDSGEGGVGAVVLYSLGGALFVAVAGGFVAVTLRRRQPSV